MITVKIEGMEALKASLGNNARQIPFAAKNALNRCAETTRLTLYGTFRAVFDMPTKQTMDSLRIVYAKKNSLSAEVKVKDIGLPKSHAEPGDNGEVSIASVLEHQFIGGRRRRKRIERSFENAGLIRSGEYLAPGPDARLDQFGNISRGQVQQIYAALGLFFDRYQNATQSKRSQRNAVAAGRLFWSNGKAATRAGKLRRGLWGADANGKRLKLILVVIPSANYKRRVDMPAITEKVVAKTWDRCFQQELAKALATAR